MKALVDLTHLNTVLRRLEVLCKLIVRVAISIFMSAVDSERIAVAVVAAISMLRWGLEC